MSAALPAARLSRPVSDEREFPGLPHDLWNFSGLFGQLVTVFPSEDVEVVRLGQDSSLAFSAANSGSGGDWEQGLYERVLASLTDTTPVAGDSPDDAQVLLDPNALDESGTTAIDWFVPSPDGRLVAVSLSKGGSESGDVHV